jgi:molecular chaperone GrpE (heat shock protein)
MRVRRQAIHKPMKRFKSDSIIEFAFDAPPSGAIPRQPPAREFAESNAGPDAPDAEAASPEEAESFSPGQESSTPWVSEEDSPCPGGATSPPPADDFAEDEGVSEEEAGESDDEADESEEEALEEVEEDEEETEDPHGEILVEIRDELAATSTENRRNTRRIFDALKQFGGVLDALSGTVNDIHSTARAQAQPAARATDQSLDIIELADRVDRIAAAFSREPSTVLSWWPPTRRAVDAWRADRARLGSSFTILSTHVRTLLKNAGIERIACEGELFDPSCMRADEAVLDSSVDDHTVLAEILPGWRESAGGRVVRPAHVRVSRAR